MAATILASWSEIDAYRQCPHKHLLGYQQRWTAPTTSKPLSRGTLWHAVLEQHYLLLQECQRDGRKATPVELNDRVFPLIRPQLSKQTEDQELIEWMYLGYLDRWGLDPQWEIVAVEHAAEFWLPGPNGGRSRFRLKMKIDLIVRVLEGPQRKGAAKQGRLWVVDHKSGQNLPTQKRMEWLDQFSLYTWGLRQMGMPVFGQLFNAARTQRNKGPMQLEERFDRIPMHRTDRELARVVAEAHATLTKAYGKGASTERNPDEERCGWRCDFTEACLQGRKLTDRHEVDYLRTAGFRQDFTRH